jgi:quercetin dioxygenase-like cupin family protein
MQFVKFIKDVSECRLKFFRIRLKKNGMEQIVNAEIEKAKVHVVVEIIEYVPNSVVIKSILKKTTGTISVVSLDTGEAMNERTLPFDTFVQIIEGKAEIVIDGISNSLNTGQSIIIPAHTPNTVRANQRFKMISTIIKSGYE